MQFSIDLHPVVGRSVLFVDRATELVLVRVMPGLLHIIDKSNNVVQVWRFPADVVAVCMVRTKTQGQGRKCKLLVSTNNGRVWCLYFPPAWLPTSSSFDDMLSSQIPESSKRNARNTNDGSSQENKRQKVAPSGSQDMKSNIRAPVSVVDIKNVASRNCVTSKDIFTSVFLLSKDLLAFHSGEKDGPKHISIHSVDSFQPYFDQPNNTITSTPLTGSQASFSTPSRSSSKLESLPQPKLSTTIPAKDLTCLMSLSLADDKVQADNAIGATLFGALFGLDKKPTVLVWGDTSGKVQFTTVRDFSFQSVLFDLKEPIQNLIASKVANSLIIIGKMGKMAILSTSKEGNLIYATKTIPFAPLSHSSFISTGGVLMCAKGNALLLSLPPKLEDINNVQLKILPLCGVVGVSLCNQGCALVLLKSGRLLKIKDIEAYSSISAQHNKHPHMLQPLLELMSQISITHSTMMKGKVAQQNEELMLTNKAVHMFSEIKALIDHHDKDPLISAKIAIFPAPHMVPTASCNLILRCCVHNSPTYDFQKNYWSLNIRVLQKDYPGSSVFTFSQPLDLDKGSMCTIDVPLQVKSVCPINVSCFLSFKSVGASQGAALQISNAVFDIFDILNPILSANSLTAIKPTNGTVFVQLITWFLRNHNKSKLPSSIPSPSQRLQFLVGLSAEKNLLHDLLSSGETGLPPHKVLQNTAFAIGKTPFGEKISITANSTPTAGALQLDIQFQNSTTIPLLHSAIAQRLLHLLHNPPDSSNSIKQSPILEILTLQSKLQALQQTLHDGSDKLSYLWQKSEKRDTKKIPKKSLVHHGDALSFSKVEKHLLEMFDILEMCTKVYEQSRNALGNKIVV